ncbi:hypothetical protein L2E82_16754 [Cichorium intybus]|uniref:Uncharacterized protein n=1 Tax=Cichorium intybus TaxID=13427 RepID=A0ACB9F725_CICIN|nr:hypothetical protein L2E82_16754 [Cichorium intybus]
MVSFQASFLKPSKPRPKLLKNGPNGGGKPVGFSVNHSGSNHGSNPFDGHSGNNRGRIPNGLTTDALAQALMDPRFPTKGLQNHEQWTIEVKKLNMGLAFAQGVLGSFIKGSTMAKMLL